MQEGKHDCSRGEKHISNRGHVARVALQHQLARILLYQLHVQLGKEMGITACETKRKRTTQEMRVNQAPIPVHIRVKENIQNCQKT
jgi:hypothetical protein